MLPAGRPAAPTAVVRACPSHTNGECHDPGHPARGLRPHAAVMASYFDLKKSEG